MITFCRTENFLKLIKGLAKSWKRMKSGKSEGCEIMLKELVG
jgi:hypothetical protein